MSSNRLTLRGISGLSKRLARTAGHLGRCLVLTVLVLGVTGCDYIPVSAGALDGTEQTLPSDWSAVAAINIIQLETNPAEPYSVNLWVVEMDGDLFVHAGANRATWITHIETNPAVRLGVDGSIFPLTATRETDQATFNRFAELWKTKYGSYPRNMNAAEAYLIRLQRP
ncbi:MAG: hypothetical protein ACFHX7_09350 [Pseudomonadota bacterium]